MEKQNNLQVLPLALQARLSYLQNAPVKCKGGEEIRERREREIEEIKELAYGECKPVLIPATQVTHCRGKDCGRRFEDNELVLRASDLVTEEDVYGLCCVVDPREIELFWAIAPTDEQARAERLRIEREAALKQLHFEAGKFAALLGSELDDVYIELRPDQDDMAYPTSSISFERNCFSENAAVRLKERLEAVGFTMYASNAAYRNQMRESFILSNTNGERVQVIFYRQESNDDEIAKLKQRLAELEGRA